jgi:large subunit ribosomal protein L17
MRHRSSVRQLGRRRAARKSLLRNLATDLVNRKFVITTQAKAKSLRVYTEKLVTIAKTKPLGQAQSLLQGKLFGKKAVKELVTKYKKAYQNRSGGYLRLTKLGPRSGDQANLVKVEWL